MDSDVGLAALTRPVKDTIPKLIALHSCDNVAVCRSAVAPGEMVSVAGETIIIRDIVEVGHKVAVKSLSVGDKIIKYGAPIGSATCLIEAGGHVHMHNMKSDYINSHTRDTLSRG